MSYAGEKIGWTRNPTTPMGGGEGCRAVIRAGQTFHGGARGGYSHARLQSAASWERLHNTLPSSHILPNSKQHHVSITLKPIYHLMGVVLNIRSQNGGQNVQTGIFDGKATDKW